VPCDTDAGCPYGEHSPGGDAAPSEDTYRALWLWHRLQTLGPLALDLIDWELTPSEADLLREQLMILATHSQTRVEKG
jgi:hypothetical protein